MKRILFLLISLLTSLPGRAEFEQAYEPVMVFGAPVLVPVESTPEDTLYLSVQSKQDAMLVAWSPSQDADYYQLQYLEGGVWKYASEKHYLTYLTVDVSRGPFRVRGCHKYGCAQWQADNRAVQAPLSIKAFYSNSAQADRYGRLMLGWHVEGATDVTITARKNGQVAAVNRSLAPSKGLLDAYVDQLTEYTLSATAFSGEAITKTLVVTAIPKLPVTLTGIKNNYKQPLYETGLDIVEKSITEYRDNLIFATHDGHLLFYKGTHDHNQEMQWDYGWHIELEGVVNNAPIIEGDFLYFTESYYDSTGRACRIRWQDALGKVCSNKASSSLLASPVLVNAHAENNQGFFASARQFARSFTSSTTRPNIESGLYIFHEDGTVEVLDPINDLQLKRQLSIKNSIDTTQGISVTPTLVMSQTYASYHPQFIIQQDKDLIGVHVPEVQSAAPEVSVFQSVSRWFSRSMSDDGSIQAVTKQQAPKELKVVWRESL
ncbi:hypothetical protein N474_23945 [Pseudoalteromonas luteoviolacea CPMOR-2]|nr:hypothetical protein [Pseudoalteromonas luteoviolacea]KZN51727.1 hypothetical protein N474_23945 [Pseudoalteromonas luteoviolacea CPMOR-2]